MKKYWLPAVIVSLVIGLIFLLMVGMWGYNTYSAAAQQKNVYEMKLKSNMGHMDNMWKQISQSLQIADTKKDGFIEVYTAWAKSGTPAGSGQMMLWLKQNAPDVRGLDIYDNVLNNMVAQRNSWTMRQDELVMIAGEFNKMMVTPASGALLRFFGFEKINPNVITSTRTENSFATGKDDDVDLRKSKTAPAQ
jgi:hypothetical protein